MYSIARATGAGIPLPICGEMTLLHPLRIKDIGAIENYLLAGRSEVAVTVSGIAASISEIGEVSDQLYESLSDSASLNVAAILRWIDTADGICMTLWMCLRGLRTWEECQRIVRGWSGAEAARFLFARNQISGVDFLSGYEWCRSIIPEEDAPDDKENGPINWKHGVRAACDMGQCNMADVGELTLFQFKMLLADEKQLNRSTEMKLSDYQEAVSRRRERQKRIKQEREKRAATDTGS